MPLAGLIGVFTLVWLPLGLGLLLSLFLLYSVGLAWSACALGRVLWHEPRSRVLAFVLGWAILAAVAAIPSSAGSSGSPGRFRSGGGNGGDLASSRATPRERGTGGRHRQGGKMPVVIPETASEPQPMIAEREMGQEGAGL